MAATQAGVMEMGWKPEMADTVSQIPNSNIAFLDQALAVGALDKEEVDA
jgi:hypothetical protein